MWKVGQTVWCVLRGKGVIRQLLDGAPVCSFDSSFGLIAYSKNGSIGSQFNRSLFFSKPKVEGATEPPFEAKIKSGEVVSVVNKISGESCVFIADKEDDHYIYPRFQTKRYYKRDHTVHKLGEQVY